jgi:phosphatidylglycerophosphate synthase
VNGKLALVRTILTDPAHLLSVVRIPLAALVWWRADQPAFVVALLVIAAVTDILDGWIGRRTHPPASGTANIGAWLDPVCDKTFLASAAVAVAVHYPLAPVEVALILLRDVATLALTLVFRLTAGRGTFHAHDFRAKKSGKLTTGLQLLTLTAAMFMPDGVRALAVATALVGAVAVGERVQLAWRDHRGQSPGA